MKNFAHHKILGFILGYAIVWLVLWLLFCIVKDNL